jgi:hypothetical protein
VLSVCEWLSSTHAGVFVREANYAFQGLAAIHVLGLAVSVGTVVWFDFRLLGISMQRCRVSEVYRRLMPWAFAGFASMFITGGLLFTGYAPEAYASGWFRFKIAAIALAGVNAFFYHRVTERRIADWNDAARPPLPARLAGLASIAFWASAILAGRMMSYTIF